MKQWVILLGELLLALPSLMAQDFQLEVEKVWLAEKKSAQEILAFSESSGHANTDFIYQRMEWEVDPAVRYISGAITSYFKSRVDQLDSVQLDLDGALEVDSIKGPNGRLDFSHHNNKVAVVLPAARSLGQIDSFTIFYKGVPPVSSSGFGSFEAGTHGIEDTPVLWTLSEPYGAMQWWPCKQSLADKIDSIDIIVTTPEAYRTASNGIVVSDVVSNGKRTMHWKHRFPIATYLVAIAVTDYAVYSDTLKLDDGRTIDILNYVYPEKLSDARKQTPRTVEIMKLYNDLIAEYPFASEKYGHAQFGWGGGMEHQTMSFMGGFGFYLVAHELAHQWFGDYITTGSWQEIWLNEGFASYLTGLCYENIETDWWWNWRKNTVSNIVSRPDGSVFVEDTTDVDRIFDHRLTYNKASYLLHMLRWVMRDEAFFAGVRNYYNDPLIANGFATTRQFMQHMEQAADTSFAGFFDDWYYGQGYPIYTLHYSQNTDHELVITLSQSTTHASVEFFKMPVPIRVFNSDHSDSIEFRLENSFNNQVFTLNPGFEVSEIQLDPELWLISKTASITGIEQVSEDNIIISPNPVREILTLQFDPHINPEYIRIFALNGSLQKTIDKDAFNIPVTDLPAGTYLLTIGTNRGEHRCKFIKQ